MSTTSRCNKCTQETREPHFLKCDHFFCYRCVVTLYNEHVIVQKMETEKQGPTHFPCGVPGCKVMTAVPLGGLRNLPRSCQLTGAMADLSLGSRAASADVKQFRGATLKWKKEGYEEIRSVAMMSDESCLMTSAVGRTKHPDGLVTFSSHKLQRFSLQGEAADLPFPCFPTSPQVVSVNQSSTIVVLVDDKGDAGRQVSVYKKHSGHWECKSFTSRRIIEAVAVTQDDCVVCTTSSGLQNTLVMMSITGHEEWTRSLPEGNKKTYISVNKHLIITSSVNRDTVSVISRQGELIRTLPREFISEPRGVTSDLSGRVVIADGANKSISLFTLEGHFIQTLVKCQKSPRSISLSQDRFLLVAEYNEDKASYELCLYELH